MKNVYDNVLEVVGNTPLVRLNSMTEGLKCNVWAKVEFTNPGGSVKDRIAMHIIDEAERTGAITPGGTIVEATSGNTGAGLAMVAALRGYKTIFVLPDKQSEGRKNIQQLQSVDLTWSVSSQAGKFEGNKKTRKLTFFADLL